MAFNVPKGLLAAALIGTSIVPLASATAQSDGPQPLYDRVYYDDPELTQEVGRNRDQCYYFGVGGGPHEGRYGPYVQETVYAYCDRGILYPL